MTQSSDRDIVIVEDKKHHIYNPWVIIIGISDYSKNDKLSNLPAVEKDVDNMYRLFIEDFKYQYVFKYLNKLKFADKDLDIKTFSQLKKLFSYHRDNMEKIHETDPIDGIIVLYSGHGDEECILSGIGKKIKINKFRLAFDNEMLPIMEGKPRIYVFDCCRGGDVEHNLPTFHKHYSEPKPVVINVSKDNIYWYGSSEGMRSFERRDRKGGVFMFEVYTVLRYMVENNKCLALGNQIKNTVFNRVMEELNQKQTPEFRTQCGYQVFLSPGKTQKKMITKIPSSETLTVPEQKNELVEKENNDLDSVIKDLTNKVNYEELREYMEGLLFGGATGDFFISKVKRLKNLSNGQVSDVTEMNIANMYGIMKWVEQDSQTMTKNDTYTFLDDIKENDNNKIPEKDREGKLDQVISFDITHIADEYVEWTKSTPFQLGNTIKQCIPKISVPNMKYKSQMMDSESRFGGTKSNGSMMRIFPLILFLLPLGDDYSSIFLILKEDSELTHYNYTCHIINCCLFFICQYLINNYKDKNKHINSIKSAQKFLQFLTKIFIQNKKKFSKYYSNLNEVKQWLSNGKQSSKNKLSSLKAGAFIRVAFERMIYYLYNKYSFVKAVKDLGNNKADNAVCYIVGSVLGAYYGISKLPKQVDLIKNCETKDKNRMKYQPKQYIDKKFIDFLSKNRLFDTHNLDSIRIYIPSNTQDDLLGGEFVDYEPNSDDSKFIQALFYENDEKDENNDCLIKRKN